MRAEVLSGLVGADDALIALLLDMLGDPNMTAASEVTRMVAVGLWHCCCRAAVLCTVWPPLIEDKRAAPAAALLFVVVVIHCCKGSGGMSEVCPKLSGSESSK